MNKEEFQKMIRDYTNALLFGEVEYFTFMIDETEKMWERIENFLRCKNGTSKNG